MKKIILLIVFFAASFAMQAQAPAIQWQKCLGTSAEDGVFGTARILQTSDGGFIMLGNTFDSSLPDWHVGYAGTDASGNPIYPYTDYWLVKMDASGKVIWQKCYGGSGDEIAFDLIITSDGGYLLVGYSSSNDGDVSGHHGSAFKTDYWIVKTNASGDIIWQNSYGSNAGNERAHAAIETTDGAYVVVGRGDHDHEDVSGHIGSQDYWVIKLDNTGKLIWQKSLGGSDTDEAFSVVQATDGGFVILGHSYSHDVNITNHHGNWGDITGGTCDLWVVKLNATGTKIEWQNSIGGTANEFSSSIRLTSDGGYIVTGFAYSYNGDVSGNHAQGTSDFWVVKLTSVGAIEWQKCLGGTMNEATYSLELTSDGGYIIAGSTTSNDNDVSGNHSIPNDFDGWIVKLSAGGNLEWQKCLGGSAGEQIHHIVQTNDGFVAIGRTNSNDGDVSGNHGDWDYWVIKLGGGTSVNSSLSENDRAFEVYPNPANSFLNIEVNETANIEIINILGATVATYKLNAGNNRIDVSTLSKGIYFIQSSNGDAVKLIKE